MSNRNQEPSIARAIIAALRARVAPLAKGPVSLSTWNNVLAGAVYGKPYSAALAAERDGKLPVPFADETAKARGEAVVRLSAIASLPSRINPFVAATPDRVASAIVELVPGQNDPRAFEERLGSFAAELADAPARWSGLLKECTYIKVVAKPGGTPIVVDEFAEYAVGGKSPLTDALRGAGMMGPFDDERASVPLEASLTEAPAANKLILFSGTTGPGKSTSMIRTVDELPEYAAALSSPEQVAAVRAAAAKPVGLLLVCGASGSGRSTTLQLLLRERLKASPGLRVVTIQRDPSLEVTEATMKNDWMSALHCDPDIIVGPELDEPTDARLALQSVRAGHVVFATLHAVSALAAFQRLEALGVPMGELTQPNVVSAVVYQDLVPTFCPRCHGLCNTAARPNGCAHCGNRGVIGRTARAEVMVPTSRVLAALRRRDFTGAEMEIGSSDAPRGNAPSADHAITMVSASRSHAPAVDLGVRVDTGEPFTIPWSNLDGHVLVIGESGTGVGTFLHALEGAAVAHGDRVTVFDSGDSSFSENTAEHLRECCRRAGRGTDFRDVNFQHPERGASYNPLREDEDAAALARRVVAAFMPNPENNAGSAYYADRAAAVLADGIGHGDDGLAVTCLDELWNAALQSRAVDVGGIRPRLAAMRTSEAAPLLQATEPQVRLREHLGGHGVLHIAIPAFMRRAETYALLANLTLSDYCAAVVATQVRNAVRGRGLAVLTELPPGALGRSLPRLLEQARSAGERLVLANHTVAQYEACDDGLLRTVIGNTAVKVVFRVGEVGSRAILAKATQVPESELASLGVGEAYVVEAGSPPVRIRVAELGSV
ncbi:MAG: hypothetical protein EPN36_14305 [Rhodanobacteraceae bacterium]|nr:MAG: hypothetical protein EPN36_14305 [Rhodanobacteraceae bacterium]